MSKIGVILRNKFKNENLVSLGAIFVIIFISTTTQLEIFYPWFSYYGTSEILKYLLPYNIMLILLYANYFITMFMNPGYVPEDFNESIKQAKKLAKLEKKKGKKGGEIIEDEIPLNQLRNRKFIGNQLKGYTPLKCDKCNGYKPARTHHCSICKRCVLRMDHHCPWVANCVGYNNVAYFGRFLGYVTVLCLYNLFLIGKRILNVIDYQNNRYKYDNYDSSDTIEKLYPLVDKKEMTFIIIDLIMLFVVIFLVTPLFAFQVMYATSNTSTIEDRENKKIQVLIEKGEVPDMKYPYDYGWLDNLKDVYGRNILNWPFTGRGTGDGVHFTIKGNCEPNENNDYLIYWPPKEYYQYKRMKKEDLEDQLENKKRGTRNYDGRISRHVRRDSEGYVVKTTTEEDRERMVMKAIKRDEERERRKQQKLLLLQQQQQVNEQSLEHGLEQESNKFGNNDTILNNNSLYQRHPNVPPNRKIMSITQVMEENSDSGSETNTDDEESSGTETASYVSEYEYDSEYDVESDYEYDQRQYMNEVYVPSQPREVDSSDLWSDEAELMNQYKEGEIISENEMYNPLPKDKNI